jgi:elongation factor P hydroxylase
MAEATGGFSSESSDLGYFIGKSGRLARYAASGRDAEMRSLNLALDLSVAATAKYVVYCDYNRKSFSSANSQRYQEAFDLYSQRFRSNYNQNSSVRELP